MYESPRTSISLICSFVDSANRIQKEEALKFRVTKSSEVSLLEKELTVEIKALERRKDELEEELKKDDELSKSIASYRAEGTVCNTFVHFLENTWVFQSSCAKQKDKRVNDELERHREYVVTLATNLLAAYKDELEPALSSIRKLVENLKRSDGTSTTEENDDAVSSRTALEEQYQAIANKVVTTFGVVESIKNQFSTEQVEDSRKSDGKVKELLDAIENIKAEFETIERPTLESVAPIMREGTPSTARTSELPSLSPRKHQNPTLELDLASTSRNDASRGISLGFNPIIALPLVRSRSTKVLGTAQLEPLEVLGLDGKKSSDAEAQLSKLKMELELENHSRGNSMEGIIDWEFDEVIEKEPRKSV
ncbi:UNVERIFIED_CONTAM: hypothetical protein Sradi_5922400 [Sesamum radiatum]|uniref:Uncharacterized protein n=1 Tax=Sesamum radiatum TaxID=300843 RepID=A0AAW2KU65_SESRA